MMRRERGGETDSSLRSSNSRELQAEEATLPSPGPPSISPLKSTVVGMASAEVLFLWKRGAEPAEERSYPPW
jgi:hypothetical protein